MKPKSSWKHIIYILGVTALIIGAISPLQGSILILFGSFLIMLSTYLTRDKHRKIFLSSFILILIGILAMFYISSFGGFEGIPSLLSWWVILMLPFPVGWLITVIVLIIRAVKHHKFPVTT